MWGKIEANDANCRLVISNWIDAATWVLMKLYEWYSVQKENLEE